MTDTEKPNPPQIDDRHTISKHHKRVADELHDRRMKDHLLRLEAWRMTNGKEE